MKKSLSIANYRDRAKILLVTRVDCDKSGEHEMCSSVYLRFPCICFADICGCAAALSCQTRTATSRRGDYHRRRSDSKSVEKLSAYHNPIIRGRSFIAALALANADLPQSKNRQSKIKAGKRRGREKLTAFLELESVIRLRRV